MKQILATVLLLISSQVSSETIYVTLEKDNALAIVDPIAGKLLKTIAIGQRPRGIVLRQLAINNPPVLLAQKHKNR